MESMPVMDMPGPRRISRMRVIADVNVLTDAIMETEVWW